MLKDWLEYFSEDLDKQSIPKGDNLKWKYYLQKVNDQCSSIEKKSAFSLLFSYLNKPNNLEEQELNRMKLMIEQEFNSIDWLTWKGIFHSIERNSNSKYYRFQIYKYIIISTIFSFFLSLSISLFYPSDCVWVNKTWTVFGDIFVTKRNLILCEKLKKLIFLLDPMVGGAFSKFQMKTFHEMSFFHFLYWNREKCQQTQSED